MGPIIYVLLQVTFLVFGKFFEKEEMQKNIKSHERKRSWKWKQSLEWKQAEKQKNIKS